MQVSDFRTFPALYPQPSTSASAQSGFQINSWPEEWQRFAEAKGLFETQPSDPSPAETSKTSPETVISQSDPTKKSGLTSSPGKLKKSGGGFSRPHKRKAKEQEEDRAEELAAANLRNPVDAMSLLVMAAGERKNTHGHKDKQHKPDNGEDSNVIRAGKAGDGDETGSSGSRVDDDGNEIPAAAPYQLSDFPLVKRGVLNTIEVFYYVNLFFTKLHPIFPLVPHHRIPRTEAQLTAFAKGKSPSLA